MDTGLTNMVDDLAMERDNNFYRERSLTDENEELKAKIKNLEDKIKQLQNTSQNNDYIQCCQHEYEYINTTPFTGHKCKKCGHSI